MRWVLPVSLLSTFLLILPVHAFLIHDEANGFRGNHWGDASGDCPSLRFAQGQGTTRSNKQVDLYDRSTVGIVLNGVTFSRIRYRFLDNQLESVQLVYEGRENRGKLLQLMEQRYGALPSGERKQFGGVEWEGEETVVNLSFNVATDTGSLWFISRELSGGFN
jgi:hypothetical protein